MKKHVILVGLPGAGKTVAGKIAAEALRAPFVDIDGLIVRRMQMPVARIFGEYGESRFRELEREAVTSALAGEPALISPGGGWAIQPDQLEAVLPASVVIYLKCMAMTAARRVTEHQPGARPLLTGDPVERIRALLKDREPHYALAPFEIRTDNLTVRQVAEQITALAQQHGSW